MRKPYLVLAAMLQFAVANAADQPSSPGAQLLGRGQTTTPTSPDAGSVPVDTNPDATLKLQGGSVAAGIGYVWGHGTVSYQGNDRRFSIHGVSVVDIGGAKISATGVVMNMPDIKDFDGTYIAWGAGVTLGGGGSAVYLKNEHGVVIKLLSSTVGLRFNLSGNGVRVRLNS